MIKIGKPEEGNEKKFLKRPEQSYSNLEESLRDEIEKLKTEKDSLQSKLEHLNSQPKIPIQEVNIDDEPEIQLYTIQWNRETKKFDRIPIQTSV